MSEATVARPPLPRARSANQLVVLVVEQRAAVRAELAGIFAGQPITVATCDDVPRALLMLGRLSPDAVLLGPVDGRLDATDFLRIVRADDPALPVVAGAEGEAGFAAAAAAAGATVVLRQPYRAAELLALLGGLTRTRRVAIEPPVEVGRLRIDAVLPRMWVDGVEIALPQREYELLRYLAERSGQVVPRAELVEALWGGDRAPSSNALTVHIMRLRKRLTDSANGEWIRAIRGHGYLFTVPGSR
ncbi:MULTISPECIES: winged-helix domain-containing protein [Thermocrispum]|jgi:DNA-binding response OmpR family regulator|uniref:Winged-helix domain-containing protein n=1 Tax=Thermocrispum agreste TaxID=37925 RepID=A0ABD6FIF6_9PSEU|nr:MULTISPECIES: winged-helix domain-containing protein [Thermocrispum]